MTEGEFSALMKKSLSDRLLFDELTATRDGADEAYAWLREVRAKVSSDLSRRRAEWSAASANLSMQSREYKRALAEYQTWRKSALGFLGMVDSRIEVLKMRHRSRNVSEKLSERVVLRDALLRVGKAIEAHQAERIDDAALYGLLDEVTLPHGIEGVMTLREVLNRLMVSAESA